MRPGSRPLSNPRSARWLWAAGLCLAGCRGVDPDVFDERLRAATFDHYVAEIDLQLAAERPELAAAELAARFRARAVAAATPWQFYRVLIDLLLELRDPHAGLELSPRAWNRSDLGSGDAIVVDAMPFPPGVVRADGGWHIAWRPATDPAADSLAARLLASGGAAEAPYAWLRLRTLDGRPVASRADAELCLRGPLLAPITAEVLGEDGQPRQIELRRNGLRGTNDRGRNVLMPPTWVARRLCQPQADQATAPAAGVTVSLPTLVPEPPRFIAGTSLRSTRGEAVEEQIDAWRLGPVGYLRLGRFPDAPGQGPAFLAAVDAVMQELADCERLVVDLQGNQGGAWDAMCHVASWFLPRSEAWIPHVGRLRTRTDYGLVVSIVDTTTRCPRAAVPELGARRVVVLVDQWTASAAEILAAILRLRRGATLVGERTAGAETWVQEVTGPDGSTLRFGLPGGMTAGGHFQGRGLEPDVRLGLSCAQLRQLGIERARARLRHGIRTAGLTAVEVAADQVLAPVE